MSIIHKAYTALKRDEFVSQVMILDNWNHWKQLNRWKELWVSGVKVLIYDDQHEAQTKS